MQKAFTLIELLIVVAIIAILAAIAVPNFLEAQTRAKVSATKSDLRTITTGLEAYAVDNNAYPPHLLPDFSEVPYPDRYFYLTTPVAFLTSVPARDKFYRFYESASGSAGEWMSYTNLRSFPDTHALAPVAPLHRWILRSRGPDGVSEPNNVRNGFFLGGVAQGPSWPYDTTNGSVSQGDLFRTAAAN
ncbi:MAG: prepilin-type N-terminal cleavage/methylation domain-containing protein [Candidatus Sumerlaeaceae bacterium]